jgi:O-antigen ligase
MIEQRGPWSTHLVLVMPLLFAALVARAVGRGARPLFQALAFALLLAASWQTGNRMMWIAFGVQLAIALALSRAIGEAPRARATCAGCRSPRWSWWCSPFAGSLIEHNERFFGSHAPFATAFERDLRPRIWSTGLAQIAQAPWLGHGYGREIVAGAFAPLTPPNYPQLRHAHNVFLDQAVELGVVGLVASWRSSARSRCATRASRAMRDRPLGVMGLCVSRVSW